MKKILPLLLALMVIVFPNFSHAKPPTNNGPICIMIKFSNDTRYDKIQSAESLSDLLAEKLKNQASLNFHGVDTEWMKKNLETGETEKQKSQWVNVTLEELLYNEKSNDFEKFNKAVESGDYNDFFESAEFESNMAQSVATARTGQFLNKDITSQISRENDNAKYLIQGTIINLGAGTWLADDLDFIAGAVNGIAQMATSQASGILGNSLGALSGVGSVSVTIRGIGIKCDMRIIKADTGEVVWCKRFKGVGQSRLINSVFFNFGHSKMDTNLHTKALDKVAQKIVDSLVEDLKSGALVLE